MNILKKLFKKEEMDVLLPILWHPKCKGNDTNFIDGCEICEENKRRKDIHLKRK